MTRLPRYKFICESHERSGQLADRRLPHPHLAGACICAASLSFARSLLLSNTGIACLHGKGDDQPPRQPAGAHRRSCAGAQNQPQRFLREVAERELATADATLADDVRRILATPAPHGGDNVRFIKRCGEHDDPASARRQRVGRALDTTDRHHDATARLLNTVAGGQRFAALDLTFYEVANVVAASWGSPADAHSLWTLMLRSCPEAIVRVDTALFELTIALADEHALSVVRCRLCRRCRDQGLDARERRSQGPRRAGSRDHAGRRARSRLIRERATRRPPARV